VVLLLWGKGEGKEMEGNRQGKERGRGKDGRGRRGEDGKEGREEDPLDLIPLENKKAVLSQR